MVDLSLNTIIAIVGFIATILTIVGVVYKIGRWTKGIDSRIDKVEDRIAAVNRDLKAHSLVTKTIVDTFIELRKKLSNREVVTIDSMVNAFTEASEGVEGSVKDLYFSEYGKGNPSLDREQRKKELLEKARSRTISYREGQELQKLLDEQKREHETRGDIGGAILLGLLILFLLGVLAALFGGEKKD